MEIFNYKLEKILNFVARIFFFYFFIFYLSIYVTNSPSMEIRDNDTYITTVIGIQLRVIMSRFNGQSQLVLEVKARAVNILL